MAAGALKKITTRAKAIYKKGGTWKGAIKKAGVEYRGGKLGKVGSAKKKRVGAVKKKRVGAVKKKRVRSVRGLPVRRVVGATSKGARKSRAVGSVASHKAAAKSIVKEQLAWNLLNQSQAKTVRSRKKLAKRTAKLKKELKALS